MLLDRGLLECLNPCCYENFQKRFLELRSRRDLKTKPRPGVTLRVRDTRSCTAYVLPYMMAVCGNGRPKNSSKVYARRSVPQFDFKMQRNAVARVSARWSSSKRMAVLLRPDSFSIAASRFLKQHCPRRRKELASAADSFVRQLDLNQMTRSDRRPHAIVAHDPSNPRQTAEIVARLVRAECKRLKIALPQQTPLTHVSSSPPTAEAK